MSKDKKVRFPAIIQHGWNVLPHVIVDAYNEELKDEDGFLGDRASKGAFLRYPRQMAKASRRKARRSFRGCANV